MTLDLTLGKFEEKEALRERILDTGSHENLADEVNWIVAGQK